MITRAVNITPALIPDPEPLPVIQDTNSDREELTPSSPASSESSELKKEIEKVDFENLMYSAPPTTVSVPVKPKSNPAKAPMDAMELLDGLKNKMDKDIEDFGPAGSMITGKVREQPNSGLKRILRAKIMEE